jgi:hypothetical protein
VLFQAHIDSDRVEHSIEVILPFLQYYLDDFQLIPIVFGPSDIEMMAAAIDVIRSSDTLVVVSADLSHYLPYDRAVDADRKTLHFIMDLKTDELAGLKNAACGKIPILILMHLARRNGWQPILLHYSNSGNTAGSRDRVVGYAAIAFFEKSCNEAHHKNTLRLNPKQGRMLVQLDGALIRKGSYQATFLPQVWREFPDPETFLSRLSLKANLPADAWRKVPLQVSTFQVQHFHEDQ